MPKQWWIEPDYDGYFDDTDENLIESGFIKAIEKSAYDLLEEDKKLLITTLKQIFDAFDADVWPRPLIMNVRNQLNLDINWEPKK